MSKKWFMIAYPSALNDLVAAVESWQKVDNIAILLDHREVSDYLWACLRVCMRCNTLKC
jgi:hypothetical protein